jgi:hypothetical protein
MLEDRPFDVLAAGDNFVESVHVELPDEGEEVVVFEVLREDLRGEPVHILHHKCLTIGSPLDNASIVRVLS